VAFIENNNGRVLIDDETGLGKTIMTLAWLQLHPERRPVVIVVPSSLKLFWKREAERLMSNPQIEILYEATSVWRPTSEIFITSFENIFNWVNKLKVINPQILILDEIHNIRDRSTNQTKAVQKLGKDVPYIICLTGISVAARPLEVFYAIKLIKPDLFPSFADFSRRYSDDDIKPRYFTWEEYGVSPNKKSSTFNRSKEKLADFIKWLQEQVDKGLIEIGEFDQIGSGVESELTNKYIADSYKRKELRSQYGIEKGAFDSPFHIDRVGLLFTRVFSDLQGITEAMDAVISRILAQGMTDGDGPALLARKIEAAINGTGLGDLGITNEFIADTIISAKKRAKMIAHTEMMRAYHKSSMQEFRNWRELGIDAKAEWKTAGDNRVCDLCNALEGKIFTVEEIEDMIPLHPECRCIALPYIEELQKYYSKPKEEEDWLGLREGFDTRKSHLPELYKILTDTIMIRRLRKDVLEELPSKMYSFVPIELDNIKEYIETEKDILTFLKRESGLALDAKNYVLTQGSIEKLMLLAVKGKLKQSLEWIRNFLELGNKLILFTSHKFVIDSLVQPFQKVCVKLDESVIVVDRQKIVDDFQTNQKLRLLVADTQAANGVITFTAVSNIAFLDLPWPPIGLVKVDNFFINTGGKYFANLYWLFAIGTIEERIANLIESKPGLLDSMKDWPSDLDYIIDK
jgi:SPP1 gp7 family putative phage head morphogenesis protein